MNPSDYGRGYNSVHRRWLLTKQVVAIPSHQHAALLSIYSISSLVDDGHRHRGIRKFWRCGSYIVIGACLRVCVLWVWIASYNNVYYKLIFIWISVWLRRHRRQYETVFAPFSRVHAHNRSRKKKKQNHLPKIVVGRYQQRNTDAYTVSGTSGAHYRFNEIV